MTKYSWNNSKCKGIWLHRYSIKQSWEGAIQEVCEICGKSIIIRITEEGRIDNNQYLASHIRQALIPQQNLYTHEYPKL